MTQLNITTFSQFAVDVAVHIARNHGGRPTMDLLDVAKDIIQMDEHIDSDLQTVVHEASADWTPAQLRAVRSALVDETRTCARGTRGCGTPHVILTDTANPCTTF